MSSLSFIIATVPSLSAGSSSVIIDGALMVNHQPKLQFPKRFLWGAATSAHQVEGDNHNQWSVWELENAKALAASAEYHFGDQDNWEEIKAAAKDPNNYVSGLAADHYHRYEQDFDALTNLNMNAFRFSVEWARIEPEEGAWNVEAIEHYKAYVRSLMRRDIEPVMTLFHFTLPVWFAAKGGFEKRSNVKYFVRFAEKIVNEIGLNVRYIITINEPTVYVSQSYFKGDWPPNKTGKVRGFFVLRNLIVAHNRVAKLIHKINRRYKVSVAQNSTFVYPGDDALMSRISASIIQYVKDDYTLKRVRRTCDFIGVNYYFSNRVYGYRIHNADERVSDLGWDMSPGDLQYALERLYRKYKLPILITENGVADADDHNRQWWLVKSLLAMQQAMSEGVKLEGYLYWSLIDNFEWAEGFWPRFGLVNVDHETLERTVRPSALWLARVIDKLRKDG